MIIDKLKLAGFRLLLTATMFCVMVNIVYAHPENRLTDVDEGKNVQAPPEVQEMFDRLVDAAPYSAKALSLYVNTTPILNAYANGAAQVVIYTGELNFALRDNNDPEQLVSVIAHEISHWTRLHVTLRSLSCNSSLEASRNCEREADYYGVYLMFKAGYDCDGARRAWHAYNNRFGAGSGQGSHPGSYERELQTTKVCNYLKTTGTMPPDLYYEKEPAPQQPTEPLKQ